MVYSFQCMALYQRHVINLNIVCETLLSPISIEIACAGLYVVVKSRGKNKPYHAVYFYAILYPQINFQDVSYLHIAKMEIVWIMISWLLRSQLIWVYTVFKTEYIRVQHGKVPIWLQCIPTLPYWILRRHIELSIFDVILIPCNKTW